jgi:hypothetical protein
MSTGSPFDYSFLAPQAAEVRGLESKSTLNMIKIGDVLQFAKGQLLEHGQFTDWIKFERTAQRYIAIAKLALGKNDTVSRLPPATVRMLAKKSTPPEIVAEVISQADVGNILSESAVEAMLSDVRETKRHAKRKAEAAERREKAKRVKTKRAAEKEIWRAEQEQRRLEVQAQAQSILDRFSPEDACFLADTLTYAVVDEFTRLVREGDIA